MEYVISNAKVLEKREEKLAKLRHLGPLRSTLGNNIPMTLLKKS